MEMAVQVSTVNNTSLVCDPELSNATKLTLDTYRYYFEGVLVTVCGVVGLLGNILTIAVLLRPVFKDCFHKLLLALACFDSLFILCAGANYACKGLDAQSSLYNSLFPFLIHPFSYIGLCGSVFLTVAISVERFLGICYPLQFPPHTRRAWFYLLPTVLAALLVNIPRFLETKLTDSNKLAPTELRMSDTHIRFYRTYFHILVTALLPLLAMFLLNLGILWDLRHVQAQRFGSRNNLRREINLFLVLLGIVTAFLILHSPRIIVDIYEFLNLESVLSCRAEQEKWFRPVPAIWKLTSVSHACTIINSGINFLIYSMVGDGFRREYLVMFGFQNMRPSYDSQRTTTTVSELADRDASEPLNQT